MALSPEEKERRKIATNARNRAHAARGRERRAVEDAGKKKIEEQFNPAIRECEIKENAILSDRSRELAVIAEEIAALTAKREIISGRFFKQISEARKSADSVYTLRNAAMKELEAQLDKDFPDLTGPALYSAACWKPMEPNPTQPTNKQE